MKYMKALYVIGIPILLIGLDYCLWKIDKLEMIFIDLSFFIIIGGLHSLGLFAVGLWLYVYKEIPLFTQKKQKDEKDNHSN